MNLLIEATYLIAFGGVKLESINHKQDEVKSVNYESFINLHDLVTLTKLGITIIVVMTIICFAGISLITS